VEWYVQLPDVSNVITNRYVQHSAAIVRLILGEKHALESLSGHATLTKEYLAPHDTIQVRIQAIIPTKDTHYVTLQAVFRTRAGATGIFELSFAAPQASRAGTLITITGTKGWIKIEPIKVCASSNIRNRDS